MTVTDITELGKKKCRIYIDEQFAFALYKGELRTYHIQKDCEISREDYDAITKELLPKRATLRAMNLLTARSYTKHQLSQKLRDGGYCEEHIDAAISYVESYGYIDDLQYALDFITYRASQLGRRQIEQKLMQKGIPDGTIRRAMEQFYEDGNEIEEHRQIRAFLEKKRYDTLEEESARQKVLAALMRKGYSYDKIQTVLRGE